MKKIRLPIVALVVIAAAIPTAGWTGKSLRGAGSEAKPRGAACESDKSRMTVYISPANSQQFRDVARYRLANGCPAISVAILFAGNYAASEGRICGRTTTIRRQRSH
jgi:hypothetical protein